jgi:hypothetical protein
MEFVELLEIIQKSIPPQYSNIAHELKILLPAVSLFMALLTCFLGHRLHKVWFGFLFFWIGFLLGTLGSIFFEQVPVQYFIGLGIALGVLGILCSGRLHKVQLFFVNGFFVFAALPNILGHFLPGWLSVLLGLAAAAGVGMLAVKYKFIVTIVTTAVTGAAATVGLLFKGMPDLTLLHWGLIVVFALGGLAVQYLIEREELMQVRESAVHAVRSVHSKMKAARDQVSS